MVRRHVASICAIPLIQNLTFRKIVFWPKFWRGEVGRAVRRHPGGTQEAPRRLPGCTQEAPRRHQGTQKAPGGLGGRKWATSELECKSSINLLILLCVFEGPSRIHSYLQTKRGTHSDDVRGDRSRPLYQHRKNPYSWRLFGEFHITFAQRSGFRGMSFCSC